MSFWIGCALWGYKGWVGDLFPASSRATDFLRLYGQRFTAVEGNTTFYSVPSPEAIARWAAETPQGFQFCPKLPKFVTHSGLLQPQIEPALQFLDQIRGLGDRLGPVFAQLPPSYSPANLADLEAFLTIMSRAAIDFAVEVRHPDWFKPLPAEQLNQRLTALGMGRVLLDTRPVYQVADNPQLTSTRKKPQLPVTFSITASFCLIRYISHPDWETNLSFLQDWLAVVDDCLSQGKRVYFFVHCPIEERSPGHARQIQHLLERNGTTIPALPWEHIDQPPTQLSLL